MLEKSPVSKISVLRSMVDQGEENEPKFIVPQNSVMNLRQKMGLSETPSNAQASSASKLRASAPATTQCQHCENMAKNFLYLESLLRTNYNANKQCSLCYSAIKYLEYVNKSILDIFGNFESVAKAAKSFSEPQKKLKTSRKGGKLKLSLQSMGSSKSKSKVVKVKSATKAVIKRQEGGGIASLQCIPSARAGSLASTTKKLKTSTSLRKKTKKKKTTKKSAISTHSVRTAEGAFENGAKVRRTKKKLKATNVVLLKQKSNKTKSKRKKIAKTTT